MTSPPPFTPMSPYPMRGKQHTRISGVMEEMSSDKQGSPKPKKEMSRGTQTFIICAFIAVLAFFIMGFSMMGQDPKFPMCELGFMGTPDMHCRNEASVRHLLRGL